MMLMVRRMSCRMITMLRFSFARFRVFTLEREKIRTKLVYLFAELSQYFVQTFSHVHTLDKNIVVSFACRDRI